MQSNSLQTIRESIVPNEDNAIRMYEAQGGQLQREWHVGSDPLSRDARQQQREQLFCARHSYEDIFTAVVGGNPKPFKSGLEYFMRLSYSL